MKASACFLPGIWIFPLPSRRGAGVVDRDGLENRCTFASTQGSNPCLSARLSNRSFSVWRVWPKTVQKWRVSCKKLRTQRFDDLINITLKSLLCSPFFSKPLNPAVSGSELLGQDLPALKGLPEAQSSMVVSR